MYQAIGKVLVNFINKIKLFFTITFFNKKEMN